MNLLAGLLCTGENDVVSKFKNTPSGLLHALLIAVLLAYTGLGAVVFNYVENRQRSDEQQRASVELPSDTVLCLRRRLMNVSNNSVSAEMVTDVLISGCLDRRWGSRGGQRWTLLKSFLYSMGIITTVGYGVVMPTSDTGKLFCILYGCIGIPLCLIILASLGKAATTMFLQWKARLKMRYRRRFRRNVRRKTGVVTQNSTVVSAFLAGSARGPKSHVEESRPPLEEEEEEVDDGDPGEVGSPLVLGAFVVYILVGALFLQVSDARQSLAHYLFANFICVTALDFGPLIDERPMLLIPFVLIYMCIGIALTTMALEVGSKYLRRLHYMGQKLRDVKFIKIWFGGEEVSLQHLMAQVGRQFSIPQDLMDNLDYEEMVSRAIAVSKGEAPTEPAVGPVANGRKSTETNHIRPSPSPSSDIGSARRSDSEPPAAPCCLETNQNSDSNPILRISDPNTPTDRAADEAKFAEDVTSVRSQPVIQVEEVMQQQPEPESVSLIEQSIEDLLGVDESGFRRRVASCSLPRLLTMPTVGGTMPTTGSQTDIGRPIGKLAPWNPKERAAVRRLSCHDDKASTDDNIPYSLLAGKLEELRSIYEKNQ